MLARQEIKGKHETFKIVFSLNNVLRKTGKFPGYTPTLDFNAMWLQKSQVSYEHGFVKKLCEQQAKVIINHTIIITVLDKANSTTTCIKLKADGRGAYGRSREGAAV